MNSIQRIRVFEYLIYTAILLVALSMPFFAVKYDEWSEVFKISVRTLPFVLIFVMNNYIFVPKLLFAEKYLYYFLACIVLVIAVTYLSEYLFDLANINGGHSGMMPQKPFPKDDMLMHDLPFRPEPPHPFFNFGQAIVSILWTGFNTGVKSFVRWNEERVLQSEREQQFLHTELAFLKHQISPHFFMNTLNNIHSLIDIDAEKARDAIIKLSRMMRYLLYEADVQTVSLKKEIEFIESYIELMSLRYDDDILTVETEYPAVTDCIFVPSFLFLSFVENAFKHGIVLHEHSLIRIRFAQENGRLVFSVSNKKSDVAAAIVEASGIGLENVRKRLELIFKDNYTLDIQSGDDVYKINLNIPI